MEVKPRSVTSNAQLAEVLEQISEAPVLAIDTEASSFHRYRVRICLIQLSTRDSTWLLDPFEIEDLAPVSGLLTDPAREIVLHDADFDLRMFAKDMDVRAANIFDTLVAAELIGEPKISLADLLWKYLQVKLDKQFQKADWSKRPLPEAMKAYAAMDTARLIELRDILAERLTHMGRLEWAQQEFATLPEVPFVDNGPEPPAWSKIKWARSLKPEQQAIVRELFEWRDAEAERRDRAPFMVLGNQVMIDLAKDPPATAKKLRDVQGIGDRVFDRYGTDIWRSIERARSLLKGDWPVLEKPKRYDRDKDYEQRLDRLKRSRDHKARELEIGQGVLCPNHLLMAIAREQPADLPALRSITRFRDWQVDQLGMILLNAL